MAVKTSNDLPSNTKTIAIGLLNARLAVSIDRALLTSGVSGPLPGHRTGLGERAGQAGAAAGRIASVIPRGA